MAQVSSTFNRKRINNFGLSNDSNLLEDAKKVPLAQIETSPSFNRKRVNDIGLSSDDEKNGPNDP